MAMNVMGKVLSLLHAMIEENKVTMTVRDEGMGIFDVEQAMEPMFTTRPFMERSGMGFTIMESFADSLSVESVIRKWNSCQVRKNVFSGHGSKQNEVTYGRIR